MEPLGINVNYFLIPKGYIFDFISRVCSQHRDLLCCYGLRMKLSRRGLGLDIALLLDLKQLNLKNQY